MRNSLRDEFRSDFTPRQYMISDEFEIYYYSDKKFTPSGSHSHSYYEFYFLIDGNIDFKIGDQSFHLLPEDMVIIPPGVKHHAVAREESKNYQRIVLWVHESFHKRLVEKSVDYDYAFKKAKNENIYINHNFKKESIV